jgi:hypothetical protein
MKTAVVTTWSSSQGVVGNKEPFLQTASPHAPAWARQFSFGPMMFHLQQSDACMPRARGLLSAQWKPGYHGQYAYGPRHRHLANKSRQGPTSSASRGNRPREDPFPEEGNYQKTKPCHGRPREAFLTRRHLVKTLVRPPSRGDSALPLQDPREQIALCHSKTLARPPSRGDSALLLQDPCEASLARR